MESYWLRALYTIDTSCHGQEFHFVFFLLPSSIVRFDPGNKVLHWRYPGGKEEELVETSRVSSNANLDNQSGLVYGIKDGRVEGQITIATNGEQATEDT
jgi:hypothetical protein